MKRIFLLLSILILFSGCFETDFNFKTVIHKNGSMDRQTQINSRGQSRFLAPTGPGWEVKASESKGKEVLFDGKYHLLQATGHFDKADQFSSDFNYDTSKMMENIDEIKPELEALKIPQPYENEIGAKNELNFFKKKSFFNTEYHYTETFRVKYLIPLLLSDIKQEVIRDQAKAAGKEPTEGEIPNIESNLIAPQKIEEIAKKRLNDEILTKFQFHSEVSMPGKIKNTNASTKHDSTAIWDFNAGDFSDDGIYTLNLVTEAPNRSGLVGFTALILIAIWIFAFVNRGRQPMKRRTSK